MKLAYAISGYLHFDGGDNSVLSGGPGNLIWAQKYILRPADKSQRNCLNTQFWLAGCLKTDFADVITIKKEDI